MSARIPTLVLGGTGYVAGEVIRLVLGHPQLELAGVLSDSQPGEPVGKAFPHLAAVLGDTRFQSQADIERLVTPATRAVLVAHLFGTRGSLDGVARVAREHGLLLWEDCAQTFDSPTPCGDARADCSMLSFGPIKTAIDGV